jgi:hypothetical protein
VRRVQATYQYQAIVRNNITIKLSTELLSLQLIDPLAISIPLANKDKGFSLDTDAQLWEIRVDPRPIL